MQLRSRSFLGTLALVLLAFAGCGSPGKGYSELCQSGGECASGVCVAVSGSDQVHSQCTGFCVSDADCQKVDPRAVCHNQHYCVLGCSKDQDCPEGAGCSAHTGGGCYQN